jgi:V8-like Glu-specific endopeptidase
MIMLGLSFRFAAALLAMMALATPAAAQEQFTIHVVTSTSATGSAYGVPSASQDDTGRASVNLQGAEESQCMPYGRRSTAIAGATVLSRRVLKDTATVHVTVKADAAGGHFRNCVTCGGKACIGILPHDTQGRASAKVGAVFTVAFDADARLQPYELVVNTPGSLQNVSASVEVKDEEAKSLPMPPGGGKVTIQGGPGRVYTVSAKLDANVTNEGGCCHASALADALVGVRLVRAPLLESAKLHPRIVGGKDAIAGQFPQVGALLQEGRPHCTATLIADDTVLTAAHCVYERDIKRLTFATGLSAWKPEGSFAVKAVRFPKGELGFYYDDKSLKDDIAIVKLHGKVGEMVSTVKLHSGTPTMSELLDTKTALTFVGYGYQLVDNSPAGVGVKRFVPIPISELNATTFKYDLPDVNTCQGDSGGPAMFVLDQEGRKEWVVAGVTSGGDLACLKYGRNTRVDRYLSWIALDK